MCAFIGREVTTNDHFTISNSERQSGLYILGTPRVGKSWLAINLLLQDIEKGYGAFFIDPHGGAIDEIIKRTNTFDRYLLLDPENVSYSFGINLLECKSIDNPTERNNTYTKAKGVFDKLWKNAFEEKPWLQLILQNALYVLIENQGYTLAELPIFFYDPGFRSYIVQNMQYNLRVKDNWLRTFASKSQRDQDEQMEAAQTRAEILLAHPYVLDIVGQTKSSIDFENILSEN